MEKLHLSFPEYLIFPWRLYKDDHIKDVFIQKIIVNDSNVLRVETSLGQSDPLIKTTPKNSPSEFDYDVEPNVKDIIPQLWRNLW